MPTFVPDIEPSISMMQKEKEDKFSTPKTVQKDVEVESVVHQTLQKMLDQQLEQKAKPVEKKVEIKEVKPVVKEIKKIEQPGVLNAKTAKPMEIKKVAEQKPQSLVSVEHESAINSDVSVGELISQVEELKGIDKKSTTELKQEFVGDSEKKKMGMLERAEAKFAVPEEVKKVEVDEALDNPLS